MSESERTERRHAVEVRGEGGFTLVELLVVVAILAVLVAIAVPSYLGYKGRAADRTAKTNLRETLPSAEAYYNDNGSYTGMTAAGLRASYDSGISQTLTLYGTPSTTYCLTDTVDGHTWSLEGPGVTAASYVPNGSCS
jgi:prepilin-type N-terminal cleavage/methylation domain-containing protein